VVMVGYKINHDIIIKFLISQKFSKKTSLQVSGKSKKIQHNHNRMLLCSRVYVIYRYLIMKKC